MGLMRFDMRISLSQTIAIIVTILTIVLRHECSIQRKAESVAAFLKLMNKPRATAITDRQL